MNNLKHELLKYTKWLREHGHLHTAPFPALVVQYLASNPKEPEAVHGNEAEKEVCENCGCGQFATKEDGTIYCCMMCGAS